LAAVKSEEDQLAPGDVVVLIFDGVGTGGKLRNKDVIRELARRGIRLFLLIVGPPSNLPVEHMKLDMLELAGETGGFFFHTWKVLRIGKENPPTAQRLREAAQLAYRQARTFSWLDLEFPRCDGKVAELRLEMQSEKGWRPSEVVLAYPRWVFLPEARKANAQR